MKLIIEKDEKAMSESAMMILLGTMLQDKKVNVSLTSGNSPKMLYQMMIPYVKNQTKYENVEYWLFDEAPYIGEKKGEPGPNWVEMQELFFKDANIPNAKIHCPDMQTYQTWDADIEKAGGLDVMLIGLGWDGHFCSNCPLTHMLVLEVLQMRQIQHILIDQTDHFLSLWDQCLFLK